MCDGNKCQLSHRLLQRAIVSFLRVMPTIDRPQKCGRPRDRLLFLPPIKYPRFIASHLPRGRRTDRDLSRTSIQRKKILPSARAVPYMTTAILYIFHPHPLCQNFMYTYYCLSTHLGYFLTPFPLCGRHIQRRQIRMVRGY